MNEMLVAKLWMGGVLAVMVVYGLIAAWAYRRARRNGLIDTAERQS